jgi:hypothetical protein
MPEWVVMVFACIGAAVVVGGVFYLVILAFEQRHDAQFERALTKVEITEAKVAFEEWLVGEEARILRVMELEAARLRERDEEWRRGAGEEFRRWQEKFAEQYRKEQPWEPK